MHAEMAKGFIGCVLEQRLVARASPRICAPPSAAPPPRGAAEGNAAPRGGGGPARAPVPRPPFALPAWGRAPRRIIARIIDFVILLSSGSARQFGRVV